MPHAHAPASQQRTGPKSAHALVQACSRELRARVHIAGAAVTPLVEIRVYSVLTALEHALRADTCLEASAIPDDSEDRAFRPYAAALEAARRAHERLRRALNDFEEFCARIEPASSPVPGPAPTPSSASASAPASSPSSASAPAPKSQPPVSARSRQSTTATATAATQPAPPFPPAAPQDPRRPQSNAAPAHADAVNHVLRQRFSPPGSPASTPAQPSAVSAALSPSVTVSATLPRAP